MLYQAGIGTGAFGECAIGQWSRWFGTKRVEVVIAIIELPRRVDTQGTEEYI
jgi:hypothetical protein